MTADLAAGVATHFGASVVVAAAVNGYTFISDPSNPRWTWTTVDSAGLPVLVSGSAAAIPSVPEYGDRVPNSLNLVQAGQTIANNIQYKLDKRIPAPAPRPVFNYKSTAQTWTTDTAFADVTGASGSFSCPIAANQIMSIRAVLPVSFGGTGGLKLQLTGPSAPTLVRVDALGQAYSEQGQDTGGNNEQDTFTYSQIGSATAFSSSFVARSSTAATSGGSSGVLRGITDGTIVVQALIINGANAGTITLQAAQNSSNSTSSIGAGSTWEATPR